MNAGDDSNKKDLNLIQNCNSDCFGGREGGGLGGTTSNQASIKFVVSQYLPYDCSDSTTTAAHFLKMSSELKIDTL